MLTANQSNRSQGNPPAARTATSRHGMLGRSGWRTPATSFALCLLLALASTPALAGDLSRYRDFQFGSSLQTVASQIEKRASDAVVLHNRPSLIQELEWRPQSLGPMVTTESVKEVVFSFIDDELFRIEVSYDRYETEGLTRQDVIAAISDDYGIASMEAAAPQSPSDPLGDAGTVIAQWKDGKHSFQLLRFVYGPTYKLIGKVSRLDELYLVAVEEAIRLDTKEAPARELARAAREAEMERAASEAARSSNKPKFRP